MKLRLRRWLRASIPLEARQHYAYARRRLHDAMRGTRLAQERTDARWPPRIALEQPIMAGEFLQNKLTNLHRGIASIEHSLIQPGHQWSFWVYVGKPSESNGFAVGRNIVDGQLTRQTGGGLCQLSGLIYHLALLAGLEVVERHPHSVDIYQEHQRFTPLGADATVVWGSKDLRLKNPYPFPVSMTCHIDVEGRCLSGRIHSPHSMPLHQVRFVQNTIGPGRIDVATLVDGLTHTVTQYSRDLSR